MAVVNAVNTSREFIFIQGPYFDADHKLRNLGFKLYWTDWHGHKSRPTGTFIKGVFDSLSLPYRMYGFMPIPHSGDACVLPLSAPTDSFSYDAKLHGKKTKVPFAFPVYREVVCVLWISKSIKETVITNIKRGAVPIARSGRVP
jgi:hypothetical protein